MHTGETVLMDLGFNYEYYRGDVGRTFPVSGHFSRKQLEIIAPMSVLGGGVALCNTRDSGHYLARGAVAALKATLFDECALHRVQPATGPGQALNGDDGSITRGRRESEARKYPLAPNKHRACAALSLITSLLGACEVQVFALRVEHGRPRIQTKRVGLAVDEQSNG
jgi:hypothetical protein